MYLTILSGNSQAESTWLHHESYTGVQYPTNCFVYACGYRVPIRDFLIFKVLVRVNVGVGIAWFCKANNTRAGVCLLVNTRSVYWAMTLSLCSYLDQIRLGESASDERRQSECIADEKRFSFPAHLGFQPLQSFISVSAPNKKNAPTREPLETNEAPPFGGPNTLETWKPAPQAVGLIPQRKWLLMTLKTQRIKPT